MLVTVVAPEFTLAVAASYLEGALVSQKKFKPLAAVDGVEWTLEHGFYANMGGFAIKVKLPTRGTRSRETGDNEIVVGNTGKEVVPMPTESETILSNSPPSPDLSPDAPKKFDVIEETLKQNKALQTNSGKHLSCISMQLLTEYKKMCN
jgi:hypothetical protein